MKNTQDFLGIFIETSEFEKALKNPDNEAILFLQTQLNALYFFQEEGAKAQEVSYIWFYQFQNNHEWGNTFEAGNVQIRGQKRQHLWLFPTVSYEHQTGGAMGYDSSYFKKREYAYADTSKKYYVLINNELSLKNTKRKEIFQLVKTQTENREWYFAKNEAEVLAEILLMQKNLQEGEWDKTIEAYVKSSYTNGKSISEIAESIDSKGWDLKKIEEIINK